MTNVTPARTLHLVDMENICGDPYPSPARARFEFSAFLLLAEWRAGDHVVVAANRWLAARLYFDLPVSARLHVAPAGRDSADRLLLEGADADFIAARFRRLVIGSGDHAFAPLARGVRLRQRAVHTVARAGALSPHLAATSTSIRILPSGSEPVLIDLRADAPSLSATG